MEWSISIGGLLLLIRRRRYRRGNTFRLYLVFFLLAILLLLIFINKIFVVSSASYDIKDISSESLEFYFSLENTYNVEWFYFAALNDLEKNFKNYNNENIEDFISKLKGTNYNIEDALINYKGNTFKNNLLERTRKFERIDKIFRNKTFPISNNYTYEFDNDWGEKRSFGGDRTHEGIDIMAEKGIPITSVGNGKVKKVGWNELGGWRIGIMGEDGIYYYYAHLDRYERTFKSGDIITKEDILGYVGNTGYGPEGTSGKFVDHLHFGMYEKNKAINPYPFLKEWNKNKE